MLTIVVLDQYEEFLQFLDPELCDIKETDAHDGLKTLELEYTFQDAAEDKKLFKLGNKIWVQGDINISDCLYVINTSVKQSVYKDNSFTLEAEEVLVELNYTTLVSHTELSKECFKTKTTNDQLTVRIDWNSLNEWFGGYFNIGVVQDCINEYQSYVPFTGTMTRMGLLRHIEEETGNVFVTRYEKDILDNTIHRYLDFLNPINVNKNWTLNLEYQFMGEMEHYSFDDNGNKVEEDNSWDVTRFLNTHIQPESKEEEVKPYDPEEDEADRQYDVEDPNYVWIPDDEMEVDEGLIKHYTSYHDIIAENLEFRILDNNLEQYKVGEVDLKWSAEDVSFSADSGTWLISLCQIGDVLGVAVNESSFAVSPQSETEPSTKYSEAIKNDALHPVPLDDVNVVLNDDCYFEIYDKRYNQSLFRTCINNQIGHVHHEVLDFGFNLEDVQFDVDETDVYTAVSPVLSLNKDNASNNSLTRNDLTKLINWFNNLKITKGQKIPMIVQKIQVKAATLEEAKASLGSYTERSGADESTSTGNWWKRPFHPQDQKNDTDINQNTWEFLRATAYWSAPYDKNPGMLFVETDKGYSTQYNQVIGRNDTRDDRGTMHSPKIGTTESSDEDIYSIYNQVALYLKNHETANVDIEVDVANLRGHEFNNYNIHDKVYIKLPDNNELVTARVVETSKEAHDIAKNTVKLSNYSSINNARTELQRTVIHATNTTFKYPASKKLTVQIENLDYSVDETNRTQFPGNKLIGFTVYQVENGSRTFKKTYTKITNYQGKCSINMKYGPGSYEIDLSFGGDEEFLESNFTVKVKVTGTKEVKKKKVDNSSKNKPTKNNNKKVTKTQYYDKLGRSPDKKKLLAIGLPSAGRDYNPRNKRYWSVTEFKNKCPKCGKTGTLFWDIFYAGNESGNWGRVRLTGNMEGGSAEGHIFCSNQRCDGDWSAQGYEHGYSGTKLTVTKKRKESSKSDAYKLKKGKYVYGKKTVTVKDKKQTSSKNRKVIGKVSKLVKDTALSIVKDKTGREAMLEICKWVDKNIHYGPGRDGYCGFQRSPDTVLNTHLCNCCDGTRLIFQLFDAAGLSEYYDMYYVNLRCPRYGHVYGRIRTKKTGHWVNIDTASTVPCYGYVCDSCDRHSPVDSKYPKMPF